MNLMLELREPRNSVVTCGFAVARCSRRVLYACLDSVESVPRPPWLMENFSI